MLISNLSMPYEITPTLETPPEELPPSAMLTEEKPLASFKYKIMNGSATLSHSLF